MPKSNIATLAVVPTLAEHISVVDFLRVQSNAVHDVQALIEVARAALGYENLPDAVENRLQRALSVAAELAESTGSKLSDGIDIVERHLEGKYAEVAHG